ncbi:hypothetical protein NHH03_05360 [Stieleria sp. TO1_6]|uniref:hypothetical protein n=1 Tax=Stieleria tagensis TaxID=2956795 RepID=UPI00209ABFA5|nr:hypothetical protein [Stieleria tagensis]MCO8121156.1 hypothetical protein [Stieleria tagensis]
MSKSAKWKAKLKSATRRRSRRNQAEPAKSDAAVNPKEAGVDVAQFLIEAALRVADHRGGLRDSAIIGALKAISTYSKPHAPESLEVHAEMLASLESNSITDKQRHQAAADLLAMIQSLPPSDVPNQLTTYLALIAE